MESTKAEGMGGAQKRPQGMDVERVFCLPCGPAVVFAGAPSHSGGNSHQAAERELKFLHCPSLFS